MAGPPLLDRWQLVSRIGTGGMGEVWLAKHTLLGREAAIKLMGAEVARDENEVRRFLQEGQIAAQLHNRHIVRVEDVGRAPDGRPYLVMEYLRGESLAERRKRVGVFTPRMVRAILQPTCAALEFAHAAGVVHRDVKPANLFLADEGREEVLKVLDFGLARLLGGAHGDRKLTAPQLTVGTPRYMSPEQAMGRADLDGRSDLWSLAVVTFMLLTGRHPFAGDQPGYEIVVAILRAEIPAPSAFNPELSPAFDAWMARALDRERTRRFQTPRQFLSSFEEVLNTSEHESGDPTSLTLRVPFDPSSIEGGRGADGEGLSSVNAVQPVSVRPSQWGGSPTPRFGTDLPAAGWATSNDPSLPDARIASDTEPPPPPPDAPPPRRR